jgi:hypothetical protein
LASAKLVDSATVPTAVIERLVSRDGKVPPGLQVYDQEPGVVPDFPDWPGDLLTKTLIEKGAGLKLRFYQRIAAPTAVAITISQITPNPSKSILILRINETLPELLSFDGGQLVQGDAYLTCLVQHVMNSQ